jgi:hypothetical protein
MEPFEYTDDPRTWVPYPRSPVDLAGFNRRLAEVFGVHTLSDQPWFRCVWGGGERELKADGRWGLKYFRVFAKSRMKASEQSGLLVLTKEREELGKPRFIVERLTPLERLAPSEWAANPRGRYAYYYEVEDERGKYRPPAEDTVEHIASCLAGEAEMQKELDLELARLARQEDEDLDRNAAGVNLPYNPGLPAVASPRRG